MKLDSEEKAREREREAIKLRKDSKVPFEQ